MSLPSIFSGLIDVLSPKLEIERVARTALVDTDTTDVKISNPVPLNPLIAKELQHPELHPVCKTLVTTPLPWAPPTTSDDPAYVALNQYKVHVELLGPGGLVPSNQIRLGVYGLLPNAEYGIRTHPAEEVFVMLAGEAYWKRGNNDYLLHKAGERSFHPSMLPHATKTTERGFLSVYVWHGDISTDNYTYQGG